MKEKPANTGISRNAKGQFPKGVSGNPAGKPEGSISVLALIKKKFREDPEYFQEWVDQFMEDKAQRTEIIRQIDGAPKQTIAGDPENPITYQVVSYADDSDSVQLST